MTLPELFHLINLGGIRLANVAGRLELRGPVVPPEVVVGAREHKDALLALLPPMPEPTPTPATDADAEEREAIQEESEVGEEALAAALHEWDEIDAKPADDLADIDFHWAEIPGRPKREPICGWNANHRLGWQSIYGVLVCAECAPPVGPHLVKEWVWEPDTVGIEALLRLADMPAEVLAMLDKKTSSVIE